MAERQDLGRTAEMLWSALDRLSEENPTEYKRFVDQQLKEGAEIISPPQPMQCCNVSVIVYKGKEKKLFINICKWKKIPAPKTDQDPVPVKGGILRHVLTKKGKKTSDLLYDVAVNPKVLDECLQQPLLLDMLHSLILDFVRDMLKIRVDKDALLKVISGEYKGLQKDIQHSLEGNAHLISQEAQLDMRESILEELSKVTPTSHNETKLPPLIVTPNQTVYRKNMIEELPDQSERGKIEQKVNRPSHLLVSTDSGFEIRVKLPGIKKISDVDLEISEDDVVLNIEGRDEMKVDLPRLVNPEAVHAKLYTCRSELVINIPFKT